jgi:WD40 repeat protein
LWDTDTRLPVDKLGRPGAPVTGLAFSLDGTWLASAGSFGRSVVFWKFPGYVPPVVDYRLWGRAPIAFSPDGRLFAYTSAFCGIKLWDIVDKRPVRTLMGHHRPPTSLAFSPGGELLASTSRDGTLRVWPIKARPDSKLTGHAYS